MRKNNTIIFFLLFNLSFAQVNFIMKPSVVSSGGGNWVTEDYNLTFTIGEFAIETFSDNNELILTEGFQQDDYQIINITENLQDVQIEVFPNPTRNKINIKFLNSYDSANLWIKDIHSKVVYGSLNFSTGETQSVDLDFLAQGIYFLEIVVNSNYQIIYQIQKIN